MPSKTRYKSSSRAGRNHPNIHMKKSRPSREATVYDAIAGRCSTQRFIPSTPYTSTTRDTATSSALPIPPDEVLFRRLGAPERDIHDDFYWADRHLGERQTLPDSDLLKAVHAYTADFYEAMGTKGEVSFRSMDETALLAFGILLEETAAEVLGETGGMAFVEGEVVGEPENMAYIQSEALEAVRSEGDGQHHEIEKEPGITKSEDERRRQKRRKTRHDKEDTGQDLDLT